MIYHANQYVVMKPESADFVYVKTSRWDRVSYILIRIVLAMLYLVMLFCYGISLGLLISIILNQ